VVKNYPTKKQTAISPVAASPFVEAQASNGFDCGQGPCETLRSRLSFAVD